jgi:hypothetical protein
MSAVFAGSAMADEWQNKDGTWMWLDGDGDGIAQCYYFDSSGYMWGAGNTTPDGYTLNQFGQWVVDGVVQTKQFEKNEAGFTSEIAEMPENSTQTEAKSTETNQNGQILLNEEQLLEESGGYNEYGISNIALEMKNTAREENIKKYGVLDQKGTMDYYGNGFSVIYPAPQYLVTQL